MQFDHENFRPGERLVIKVGGGISGLRLDNYLCSRFGHLSRAKMQRIILNQEVLVNGQRGKPSRRVYFGDVVEFTLLSKELVADDIPIDIIYEDQDIIVVNKQPGILIHPARGNSSGTLLNAIAHYAAGRFEPDVVHRLDRNTSGTMVFSKNQAANVALSAQFEGRETQKEYLAIVHGTPSPLCGQIEQPIGQADANSEKYAVMPEGRYALTLYETISSSADGLYSLVRLDLKTGRSHQIRVHLSHIGCPIVGDTLYGGKIDHIERCALHAQKLAFNHPTTGQRLEFNSPLPQDMAEAAEMLSL